MAKTKDDEEEDGEMAYAFDKSLLHFDPDRLRRNPSIAFTDKSIRRRSLWQNLDASSRSAHLLLQTELDSQIHDTLLVALGGNREHRRDAYDTLGSATCVTLKPN